MLLSSRMKFDWRNQESLNDRSMPNAPRKRRSFSLIFQMAQPSSPPCVLLYSLSLHRTSLSLSHASRIHEQWTESQAINTFSIHHAIARVCEHSEKPEKKKQRKMYILLFEQTILLQSCVVLFVVRYMWNGINQINYLCFWINPQLINKVVCGKGNESRKITFWAGTRNNKCRENWTRRTWHS